MEYREAEAHISDYLKVLKSRKGVIITFFFVTVFTVTAGSFLMDPVYRATVTLLIDLESPNVLTTSGSVALKYPDYYAYKEYFQSQKEMVKSRTIAKQIFKEFKLSQSRDYLNARDKAKAFLKTIKVEPVRDTRLLLLNVDNKDPVLAADIANRIAEVYVERNLSYITKTEIINLLKNEYLKLQARLSEYSKVYKDKHPKMIRLKQEMEQMSERIKQEMELSSTSTFTSGLVLTGLKANNISIQDPAEVPIIPIKPKKRLNILLSVIVGLFGGIGLAFFFEYLDDTVKDINDVKKIVNWPFLGNIPRIEGIKKMTELKRDLFTQLKPEDPVSEAFRAIRTSIVFSSTEEHPLKSIVVTSPGPKEGKTTLLCNLAIVVARSQRKVLLVDADMRKPRLHTIFKAGNDVGISNFLSGQADFNQSTQKTEIKNLFLVSSGPNPPDPSELLSSHKMKEFIEDAKRKFDFILFDSPPVTVVTDAVVLSRIVDGAVVILESSKTNKRAIPGIDQLLKNSRVRVIGAIINKISPIRSGYRYYAQYYGGK
ncbi:MAG: polysaccharide biosynthesis tyrosine autokinase [Candidatus Omnitrophota bacterium]|nr:polysaccharide biosynthesis tyrosine autokinase [Candidatus Omnitrophota bacterium]